MDCQAQFPQSSALMCWIGGQYKRIYIDYGVATNSDIKVESLTSRRTDFSVSGYLLVFPIVALG